MARFEWTWFKEPSVYPELTPVMLGLGVYWLIVFFFSGYVSANAMLQVALTS